MSSAGEGETFMSQISLQADETYMDERLDKFLSAMLPDQSRSYLQKIIKDGNVLVNGEPKKSSYRLEYGDEVTADLAELKSPDIEPENIPLDTLYEDDSILMVNKPKGMVVHPSAGHYTGTLVNAVLWHCQGQLSGINGVSRPGIVHRIDKDTSGLLIAAAAFSASVTDWSGDSKFWYCLTDWCVNGSQTLNAFPLWVFILAQFIAAVALFVSAYRDHKKQA